MKFSELFTNNQRVKMITSVTHDPCMFNIDNDSIESTIESPWHNVSKIFNVMLKTIKFLTIVAPIAYTMTAPIVAFIVILGAASYRTYETANILQIYYVSVVKVWEIWFNYVGISH